MESLRPQDVVTAYEKYKTSERGRFSVATSNWPTALSHPCTAYALYNRIVPSEARRAIGTDLAMIFSEGNDQARIVKRDLEDAGFEVTGQESQMVWAKYQISGRQDVSLYKKGYKEKVHCEIKSCAPFTYDAIHTVQDLMNEQKEWLHRWYKQVCLYMVLQGVERYWLILKNKARGGIKIIEFTMTDHVYETAEAMLQKAEHTNKLVQIGGLPDKNDKLSDPDYCAECPFFDTCLPNLAFGPGATVLTDEQCADMEMRLNRRKELEPAYKEFKDLDEEIKEDIKGIHANSDSEQVVAGDWICLVKESQRKAYTVNAQTIVSVKFVEQKKKE